MAFVKAKLTSIATAVASRTNAAPFRVVIAYEDFSAGRRGMDTCHLLNSLLGNRTEVATTLWNFEVLAHPDLSRRATHEAAEADVIVISTSVDRELPLPTRLWIESWAASKQNESAALIALLANDVAHGGSAPFVHSYLEAVAGRTGMDFICRHIASTETASEIQTSPLFAAGSVREFSRPAPECWGINE